MALNEFDAGLEAIRASENRLADFPDFHHVCGLFYMKLIGSNPAKYISDVPKIEQSFQRSLALGETDKYKSVHGSGSFLANYNLGVFYHAFGDDARAKNCLKISAATKLCARRHVAEKTEAVTHAHHGFVSITTKPIR